MTPTINVNTTSDTANITMTGSPGQPMIQILGLSLGETGHLTMDQVDAHARHLAKHALQQAMVRL